MCKDMCRKGCCTPAWVAKVLLVIGGINWGLIGLGLLLQSANNWNVVNMILDFSPEFEGIVYILVGIAGVMMIFGCKCGKCSAGTCGDCKKEDAPSSAPGASM